jgi:hypothetical protein
MMDRTILTVLFVIATAHMFLPTSTWGAAIVINNGNSAFAIDATNGELLGGFGSGFTYGGITVGPNGLINWVCCNGDRVARRPNLVDSLASIPAEPSIRDLGYGPDGNLYAIKVPTAQSSSSGIVRYDPVTGAFIDVFVPFGGGDSASPFPGSFAFGPNGDLYLNVVTPNVSSEVLRFNGSTGAQMGTFISMGSGGIAHIYDLAFGTNGDLYASVNISSQRLDAPVGIAHFNGDTGSFIGFFIDGAAFGLEHVAGFTFGSDGNLYVAGRSAIFKFDPQGQLITLFENFGGDFTFIDYAPNLSRTQHSPASLPATLTLLAIALGGLVFIRSWNAYRA